MKRFIFTLLLLLGIAMGADAQVMRFSTTDYYTRTQKAGVWGDYVHQGKLIAKVNMDLDDDVVTIYTQDVQVYNIYDYKESYRDGDGDLVMTLKFIDNDDDTGTMRVIIRQSGKMQLYIDFDNIPVSWAYDITSLD